MQAAILRARLAWLPGWTDERRALAAEYRRHLAGAPVTVPPEHDAGHVYHLFPILTADRAALQAHLKSPRHRNADSLPRSDPAPAGDGVASSRTQCPIADRVCTEVLSLPLHPGMTRQAVEEVAAALQARQRP